MPFVLYEKPTKSSMKRNRLAIVILCMLVSFAAKSQFAKGDRLIGGAINIYSAYNNYTYSNNPTNNNNSFGTGFVPRYSWVTKDNTMNGVYLSSNYSQSKTFSSSNSGQYSKNIYFSLGLGYFIRKYKDFNQQLGWFLEYNGILSYRLNKQTQNVTGNTLDDKSTSIGAGVNVSPGLYYRVSPAVLVEAGFGGANATYSKGRGSGTESHGVIIGLNFPSNFTFGLQFLLGRKQSNKS